MHVDAMKQTAVEALEEIKARDITVLDVRKMTSLFEYMIVATAESARQTKALARHVQEKLKEQGVRVEGLEGEKTGEWVLVDLAISSCMSCSRKFAAITIWNNYGAAAHLCRTRPCGDKLPARSLLLPCSFAGT